MLIYQISSIVLFLTAAISLAYNFSLIRKNRMLMNEKKRFERTMAEKIVLVGSGFKDEMITLLFEKDGKIAKARMVAREQGNPPVILATFSEKSQIKKLEGDGSEQKTSRGTTREIELADLYDKIHKVL